MVFISSLLGLALVTIAVSGVVHLLGLGTFDRLLGVFFGIVRGAVAVTILVVLAGLTSLPQQGAWRNAMFSPPFEAAALCGLKIGCPPRWRNAFITNKRLFFC